MNKPLFYGILLFAFLPKANAQSTKSFPSPPAAGVQMPQMQFPQVVPIPRAPTFQEMAMEQQNRVQQQNNAVIQADMLQYERQHQ